MSRILVVTNASHDDATNYLEAWSRQITQSVQKQSNIRLLELRGVDANRKSVEEVITKEHPQLVIFNGHGASDAIFGHKHEILIKQGENDSLLSKKIVHALACKSGQSLGPSCISIGGIAYIGYKENFKFIAQTSRDTEQTRLQDPYAPYFLNPAFSAIIALVEGKSVGEAYKISQDQHAKNLLSLVSNVDDTYSKILAPQVYHNLRHQVCLGDQEAAF